MKKEQMKNTKGITIISLIVTIIVLLILAGISIAMITGKNGILTQANKAKKLTEVSSEKEGVQIIMQMHYLEPENEKYNIGTKLYSRELTNGDKWNIVITKEPRKTNGNGWRYIEKGTNLLDYGNAKYSWLYNEQTGETIQLEDENYEKLAYGENLAVTEGLVFNLDPLNMEDENSWGSATLYGFNGVEKDEQGNVISGFSGKDFSFDGKDDYIEVYTDEDFSEEGITIEMYGNLDEENSRLGFFYKGPASGSLEAFKYSISNSKCSLTEEDIVNFKVNGTFYQGIATGTKYQCPNAENDFHIPIYDNKVFNGEAYVTFTLKDDGTFYIILNGKKVVEDKFNSEYVEHYKEYLSNIEYPILIGRTTGVNGFSCRKFKTYTIRIYNKALTEEEAILNQEKTILFRDTLL